MERVRAGLYRAVVGGHVVEVEYYPPSGQWTFYIDGEVASNGWETKREAAAVAVSTANAQPVQCAQ